MTHEPTGIFADISNQDYHGGPGVSKGHLDKVRRGLEYYHAEQIEGHKPPPSPAMIAGTIAHCAVLEPDRFERVYMRAIEGDGRTKAIKDARKQQREDNPTKEIVPVDLYDRCLGMAAAVKAHPMASKLLREGTPEQSAFWHDKATGLYCRCRPDWVLPDGNTIVDLKTTSDPDLRVWTRKAASLRYHVQAAWYSDGYEAATGHAVTPDNFVFVVVGQEYPHACYCVTMSPVDIIAGRVAYRDDLSALAAAKQTGEYHSFPQDEIVEIELPGWA